MTRGEGFADREPAHPRSRGENPAATSTRLDPAGSSPLTRGKSRRWPIWHRAKGLIPAHAGKIGQAMSCTRRSGWLIPAHAGKISSPRSISSLARAHPRSRGENLLFDNVGKDIPGSSPLTRGKFGQCDAIPRLQGLIPAHAGKMRRGWLAGAHRGAHPRSRGENTS